MTSLIWRGVEPRPTRGTEDSSRIHILWTGLSTTVATGSRIFKEELVAGYPPHSALTCLAPKPGWMLRPGAVLSPDDEVIYNLLVGRMMPQIWQNLKWSQGETDISYQLRPQSTFAVKWVRRGTGIWREWREKSVARLTPEISHVVETDIVGFYENIDINRLLSDLRALNVCDDDLQLLRKCLKRWAATRGKGIPQGYTASDILAKVYINPIDRSLSNAAIQHLRYVDNIRIFCGSKRDAKLAIRRLTELISHRGLNVQSAKTRIMSKPEAEAKFKGATQLLEDLATELREEFQVVAASGYESTNAVFKACIVAKAHHQKYLNGHSMRSFLSLQRSDSTSPYSTTY